MASLLTQYDSMAGKFCEAQIFASTETAGKVEAQSLVSVNVWTHARSDRAQIPRCEVAWVPFPNGSFLFPQV